MESIAEVLESFVDERGIRPEIQRARLHRSWTRILGEPLARHLSIRTFQNGELVLTADDPSWGQEASMQRETIRRTINEHFDREVVRSIRVHGSS